jgi:hypothetical protein
MSELVGDARHERRLGSDHDQVGRERHGQTEHAVTVVGAHRMALPERGDPGISGRGMELGQPRALSQPPRERVLASA